ncbi:MAG: single-stranded-DNA-specific exonuclease RecJ [Anaerolineae bacterium]|nr:single-stranded-DNA-specific exonuclease RecJ [Anaerolineae bacterium]
MNWLLPSDVTASQALRESIGGHPLVADILARRGLDNLDVVQAFLDPAHYKPAPPGDIPDLDIAASRLLEAVRQGEHILVWGDFDVDGQTSTALLVDALRDLGARVSYHIPLRLVHSHGVHVDVLRGYIEQGVRLVLTCDTGVDAHEVARLAREAGVTLLITDHHALPETLPDAPAVVNPQRLPEGHPLRDLPGVGVAYKLIEALYDLAGRGGEEHRFLDLVALGIVADVAAQRHDTRYLLQTGIESLRNPQRLGLQALMRSAKVDPANLSASTIGYQVGPRLNALGRLDDARLSVELLTTHDEPHAQQIAAQLELLNTRRKQIEDQIAAAAQEQIAKDPSLLDFEVLVLDSPHWHAGVVGIVASRLADQYQRPVVLLISPEGSPARGSARSVPGVNIVAAFAANEHLLLSYGGHAGAAGLSMDAALIPQFRRQLSTVVSETRDPDIIEGRSVDAVVSLGDLTMELTEELDRLAPFGEGNPPITLMIPNLRLTAHTAFGVGGRHRRLTVEDSQGAGATLIWWRGSDYPLPGDAFDVLLVPHVNDYKGMRSMQLEWVDSRPLPGAVIDTGPRYNLVDLRREAGPEPVLPVEGLIWAEATDDDLPPALQERAITRLNAAPCQTLIIWTSPPGPQELIQMLDKTRARDIHVLARDAHIGSPAAFLERLAGLVKYAQHNYNGEISVLHLACATAQREVVVRRGIEWLAARGQLRIEWLDGDRARLAAGGAPDEAVLNPLQDAIRALLAETSAYRAYFCRANLASIFKE